MLYFPRNENTHYSLQPLLLIEDFYYHWTNALSTRDNSNITDLWQYHRSQWLGDYEWTGTDRADRDRQHKITDSIVRCYTKKTVHLLPTQISTVMWTITICRYVHQPWRGFNSLVRAIGIFLFNSFITNSGPSQTAKHWFSSQVHKNKTSLHRGTQYTEPISQTLKIHNISQVTGSFTSHETYGTCSRKRNFFVDPNNITNSSRAMGPLQPRFTGSFKVNRTTTVHSDY